MSHDAAATLAQLGRMRLDYAALLQFLTTIRLTFVVLVLLLLSAAVAMGSDVVTGVSTGEGGHDGTDRPVFACRGGARRVGAAGPVRARGQVVGWIRVPHGWAYPV